jgi:DNA-binding beta-propeller fold protein YncE
MRFLPVLGLLAACGASSADSVGPGGVSVDAATAPGCLSSNECPTGEVCNEFGQCEAPNPGLGDAGVPPEVEYTFGKPVSSRRFFYVAMTSQNELARIDGRTLAVTSTPVGASPRTVAAIPGGDAAVVLDSANGTGTIVRPTGTGDSITVLPTLPHLNRLEIDPSGRFAVVWFDLIQAQQDGGITGIGSFQDVTVIALAAGAEKAVDLTVGFRPRNVQFDATGDHAYVVTQDGVSAIDLVYATSHEPTIVPPIPVADPSVSADDLEVNIVATGHYAAVRQNGAAALRVVDLVTNPGQAYVIPLASAPTDLDLAPDGTRVFAVERDAKKLAIVDIPGDAIDPSGVETIDLSDATLGSLVLSNDGRRALLFTNAELDERLTMVKLDTAGYPHVTWPLQKSVRAVGMSPDGTSALVLHAKIPGDPSTATSFDDYIDKSYGYSLVDLASGFAKLEITPVDPGAFAYAPDSSKAYLALDGGDAAGATKALQIVHVQNGVVTTQELGSPPSAVGVLPDAGQAFTAQRHPLGRVSFADLTTDAMRTVTGFDLNSHIVN